MATSPERLPGPRRGACLLPAWPPQPRAPVSCIAGACEREARAASREDPVGGGAGAAARSPEPGAWPSSKCAPPAPAHAAAPRSPALRSLTLAPPRFWAHAGSRLCEFRSFAKFFAKERTPTLPPKRRPAAAPLGQTRVPPQRGGSPVRPWRVVEWGGGLCAPRLARLGVHPPSPAGRGHSHWGFLTSLSRRPV